MRGGRGERSTLAAVVCVQRWRPTMKETTPRNATTEMTIIRTDKIAFDERQPVAPRPTQTFPWWSRRSSPASSTLRHSLTLLYSLHRVARRQKIDQTGNAAGPETRLGWSETGGRTYRPSRAGSGGRAVGSGCGTGPSRACVRRMRSRVATNRWFNLRRDGECQRCIKRALKRGANWREIIGLFFFLLRRRQKLPVGRIAVSRDESRVIYLDHTANCLILFHYCNPVINNHSCRMFYNHLYFIEYK